MSHLTRTRAGRLMLCSMILLLLSTAMMACGGNALVPSESAFLAQTESISATPETVEPDPSTSLSPSQALPRTLARVRMAFDGHTIVDARADVRRGVIYVTDSSPRLHVLDIDTYVEIITLSAGGQLTLDTDSNRLYAASGAGVTVIDTATRAILTTLPGTHLNVDATGGRLYVGERVQATTPEDASGVRLYNSDTLELLTTGEQPGIPVYNPLRDELLIVAYTVYTADSETLAITGDLLPELSEQPARWCNGCDLAQQATVFPEEDLLAVEVVPQAVGRGAGALPPPRFWSASTLTPDPAAGAIRSIQPLCSQRRTLRPLVNGRAYRSTIFQRYVTITNLSVYDKSGTLLHWRDGMTAGFINAHTGQSYAPDGAEQLRVVDLDTLQPVEMLPIACVLEHDAASGRIYGAQGGDLYILAESGGEPQALPPIDAPLPAEPVQNLVLAPTSDGDGTGPLFAVLPGRIYRSLDGGETWAQLRGGLPVDETDETDETAGRANGLAWTLALSPEFETDETLFAGGTRGTAWGEGVWRSQDAGESWQPLWNGLQHLRIDRIELSPEFAADGTLIAYAQYDHLAQGEAGVSVFRSTERGLAWELVRTATSVSQLPSPDELLGASTRAAGAADATNLPVRVDATGRGLERTAGGQTWHPVDVPALLSTDSFVQAILVDEAGTVFVVAEYEIVRSPDGGLTWERWVDPRLAGRDFTNSITTAALSDSVLLVGTANGEVWTISPGGSTWQPVGD